MRSAKAEEFFTCDLVFPVRGVRILASSTVAQCMSSVLTDEGLRIEMF